MIRLFLFILTPAFLISILSSCSSMTPGATKRAYCNMLKSNLVFNGATGVTREANIQNANTPLDQRTYDEAECAD